MKRRKIQPRYKMTFLTIRALKHFDWLPREVKTFKLSALIYLQKFLPIAGGGWTL